MELVGLTKSWVIELAPHNIRVNSVHATGMNTPMNDGLAALEGKTSQEIAEHRQEIFGPFRGLSLKMLQTRLYISFQIKPVMLPDRNLSWMQVC